MFNTPRLYDSRYAPPHTEVVLLIGNVCKSFDAECRERTVLIGCDDGAADDAQETGDGSGHGGEC